MRSDFCDTYVHVSKVAVQEIDLTSVLHFLEVNGFVWNPHFILCAAGSSA
jgi:hypothetical protein